MQSELHERLEYLVNYSSQLIFVSGDSISEQQKTLEAFVFQQHDDTEIAYLTAQDNMEPSDYRRQLCRQLLGQVVGSFVRPLNELLSALNQHDGPILIAITQAHHISDKLLQELWDLVLQSRFAGNKQHLNVLLFANNRWAENAKQWLPAKNTETPLIISSESVMSEQPTFESDLDKMIATRRSAFQEHLENRKIANAHRFANPLKSRWLYVSVAMVFAATFAGLMYWQYADNFSGLFAPINNEPVSTETQQIEVGSAYDELLNTTQLEEKANKLSDTGSTDTLANIEVVPPSQNFADEIAASDTPTEAVNETQVLSLSDTSTTSISPENEALVTDWDKAISSLEVPESTTVETTDWIAPNEYVIQLLAMKNEFSLQLFLDEHNLLDLTRIYKTQRYGGDWFVVVTKENYPSLATAKDALSTLPNFPGRANAFVKRGNQVLAELKLTGN